MIQVRIEILAIHLPCKANNIIDLKMDKVILTIAIL